MELLIRDDGSDDATRDILLQAQADDPRIAVIWGEHLGPAGSFLELVRNSDATAEFFAFSDQDDVWDPRKLQAATEQLRQLPEAVPRLFCSGLEVVDERLAHVGYFPAPKRIGVQNALVQNVFPGCSMVFNKPAMDLARKALPRVCAMHDWWMYLLVCCFGTISYDPTPLLKYRQHRGNVVGFDVDWVARWLGKCRRLMADGPQVRCTDQARLFIECYGPSLDESTKHVIQDFIGSRDSRRTRWAYAATCPLRRQTFLENLVLRAMILLGRY